MHTITISDDRVLVKIQGPFGYPELKAVISDLGTRMEHSHKHDIWDLGEGPANLVFDDLENLVRDAGAIFPPDPVPTRTALVAPLGLIRAMAELWSEAAVSLPNEVGVFASLDEAEAWISSGI